jgi:hypothetical protein
MVYMCHPAAYHLSNSAILAAQLQAAAGRNLLGNDQIGKIQSSTTWDRLGVSQATTQMQRFKMRERASDEPVSKLEVSRPQFDWIIFRHQDSPGCPDEGT